MELVSCVCRSCGSTFDYSAAQVARGRGQFCSKRCSIGHAKKVRWENKLGLRERLEAKIMKRGENECWAWTGFKHKGYGRIRVGGLAVGAHRVSYELNVGPITDGLTVLHRCDNPECTNPKHLFLGTNADNNADRDAKGRNAKGESSYFSKLTEDAVRVIRRSRPSARRDRLALADRFGVQEQTIRCVLTRRTWRHVA